MTSKIFKFEGINFIDSNYNYLIDFLIKKKGYLVAPAASSLSQIHNNIIYRKSLQQSTAAIFDSGFFCLCLILIKFLKFRKFSGYKFLNFFLNDKNLKKKKILSLDPSENDMKLNNYYIKSKKFQYLRNYVCPIYNKKKIVDINLLNLINKYKPDFVIINIAGEVQEPLALYIKNNSSCRSVSICTGAAISFFTGSQAKITDFIDNFYLGWLARILHNPKYLIRIIKSINLIRVIFFSKVKVLS
jgi:N-acetylglucosaminyldiphosphoundecaprenol N-acetyl-beta-D-mannosaminyltransferase